jgi:hypothetical protein
MSGQNFVKKNPTKNRPFSWDFSMGGQNFVKKMLKIRPLFCYKNLLIQEVSEANFPFYGQQSSG